MDDVGDAVEGDLFDCSLLLGPIGDDFSRFDAGCSASIDLSAFLH